MQGARELCSTTLISAPTDLTPRLPPNTPSVSHKKKTHLDSDSDEDVNDEDNPAILDRIVQCGQNVNGEAEFVLEEGIGPALKFAEKGGGVALTPIKMPNLDDKENEMDDDNAKKYSETPVIRPSIIHQTCKSDKDRIIMCTFSIHVICHPPILPSAMDFDDELANLQIIIPRKSATKIRNN